MDAARHKALALSLGPALGLLLATFALLSGTGPGLALLCLALAASLAIVMPALTLLLLNASRLRQHPWQATIAALAGVLLAGGLCASAGVFNFW